MCKDQALSTNEHLERLDLDQLKYAKMRCEALIKKKEQEEQVTIWRVCEGSLCHGNFLNYLDAANHLVSVAKELEEQGADDYDKSLELRREYLPESEVAGFIAD